MSLPPGALNVVLPFNPCDIAVTSSFIVSYSDALTDDSLLLCPLASNMPLLHAIIHTNVHNHIHSFIIGYKINSINADSG